jgi:hypothetical protein
MTGCNTGYCTRAESVYAENWIRIRYHDHTYLEASPISLSRYSNCGVRSLSVGEGTKDESSYIRLLT